MISEKKFVEVLVKLLNKSKGNGVAWAQFEPTGFEVAFDDKHRIAVTRDTPRAGPNFAAAALLRGNVVLVEVGARDGMDLYRLLNELYDEAHRCVTGWDDALAIIDKQLGEDRTVGRSKGQSRGKDFK